MLKAKEEEEEEEEEPDRWVQDVDGAGNIHYWHRRSRRSVWRLPDGAFVKAKERRRKKKKKRRRRRKTRDLTISTATVSSTCVSAGPASFSRRTLWRSRVVFPLVVGIMAGMDQKDSNAVF